MMFSAGTGIGLMFYGVGEPLAHYWPRRPPPGRPPARAPPPPSRPWSTPSSTGPSPPGPSTASPAWFLVGVLLVPSGATVIWCCAMGGTAIRLDSTGAVDFATAWS